MDTGCFIAKPLLCSIIPPILSIIHYNHHTHNDPSFNIYLYVACSSGAMAKRLGELMNKDVSTVGDCIGAEVDAAVGKMQDGDVLMLENARFYKEEEKNSPEFAEKLAKNATIFVNDAFGTAHRAHASTEGVCKFVDHKVAGFLLEKEIKFLKGAVDAPVAPFAAIVGGAKVSG